MNLASGGADSTLHVTNLALYGLGKAFAFYMTYEASHGAATPRPQHPQLEGAHTAHESMFEAAPHSDGLLEVALEQLLDSSTGNKASPCMVIGNVLLSMDGWLAVVRDTITHNRPTHITPRLKHGA